MDGSLMADDYGKAAKKLSKQEASAIVTEARERLGQSWEADRDNRGEAARDLRFLAGDQWPAEVRREREADERPMLTVNVLPQFLRQVTNPIREAELSIKTAPADDGSDPNLAKIYDGLIRQIQYQSSAKAVYAKVAEHQAGCGIGWFQITTQYVDDAAFDQEIRLKAIASPLAVYDDPGAVEPDRCDSMWRHVTEMVPVKTFEAKWPKASKSGVDVPSDGSNGLFWYTQDAVRVSHYWRKVPVQKTIALLPNGHTVDVTDMDPVVKQTIGIVRERVVDTHRVEMYVVSGTEVLEGPYAWPGKYLPQIPAIGSEIPVESGTLRYGVIRWARDPQQLYNYARTTAAESIALAPKSPLMATPHMIGPYKDQWDTANKKNRPYLLYQPDPKAPALKPERIAAAEMPTALIEQAQSAEEDIKRTTGIFDASLGARSNETSGVAINQRLLQGDRANYHYGDNMQRSLEYAGRVLIDLIPKVYDNERIIRIMGEDDSEEFVPINQVIMGQDGMPVMLNDLSAARFDVRVRIGRSADSRRLETAEAMYNFLRVYPNAFPLVGDLIAKNSDWPGADEIAKRLKNMVPAQALVDPDDPEAPPPPNPMDDPMVQAELAEKEGKARKTNAEADEKEMQNAMTATQAAMGYHPSQQPPEQPEDTGRAPYQ